MNNVLISIISLLGINTPSAGFYFTSFTLNTKHNKGYFSFTILIPNYLYPFPITHNLPLCSLFHISHLSPFINLYSLSTCVKPSSFTEHAPIAKYNTASRRPRDFFPTATAARPMAEAPATKASLWLWNLMPRIAWERMFVRSARTTWCAIKQFCGCKGGCFGKYNPVLHQLSRQPRKEAWIFVEGDVNKALKTFQCDLVSEVELLLV